MLLDLMHCWPVALPRFAIMATCFMLGCLSITFGQFFANWILASYPGHLHAFICRTKNQFLALFVFVSSVISPCAILVTFDSEESSTFTVDGKGNLRSHLSLNAVYISNHQIYTDWLYLWFLSYTGNLADSIYIVLKDMSSIPILGYGMKNFGFLFLSRKWEKDKVILTNQLLAIDANARGAGPANGARLLATANVHSHVQHWPEGNFLGDSWPFHLIIFPEGTVPLVRTQKRSLEYTTLRHIEPFTHVLSPRTRGLLLTLRKLRGSTEVVYDVTVGYLGLEKDEYGEDIFSLKRFYMRGMGPPKVNFHIRQWRVQDIPLGDDSGELDEASDQDIANFEHWLMEVWREKDGLMADFYANGHFPLKLPRWKKVEGRFKLRSVWELVLVFTPLFAVVLLVRLAWIGALFVLKK